MDKLLKKIEEILIKRLSDDPAYKTVDQAIEFLKIKNSIITLDTN